MYNNIVSSDTPGCVITNLEFVYRGEGVCSISLSEVCLSSAKLFLDVEHTS